VKVRDNGGILKIIAVDVTVNPKEEEEKLGRIQGKPEPDDAVGYNRNANLPSVRKELGIDKHLVLTLNSDRQKLPSYEKLLTEIYAFANGRSRTGILDLGTLSEKDLYREKEVQIGSYSSDPKQLYTAYVKEFAKRSAAEQLQGISRLAFFKGHSQERVSQILMHHPFFESYLKKGQQSKAEEFAKTTASKAYEEYLEFHLQDVLTALESYFGTLDADETRAKVSEGEKYILESRDGCFTITAKDGRGVIFSHSQDGTTSKMKMADIKPFATYTQELESQSEQIAPQVKPRRFRRL
jgi:hypothetical protein